MNLRAFALVLAVLIAAATIYPPYLWGLERKTDWQLWFQHQVPMKQETMPDYAPVKARSFLLGSNEKDIYTGAGTERLKRQLSWDDLLLEYVLALCVACIVGVLASTRKRKQES